MQLRGISIGKAREKLDWPPTRRTTIGQEDGQLADGHEWLGADVQEEFADYGAVEDSAVRVAPIVLPRTVAKAARRPRQRRD
jgi:hypothetical protein